MSNNPNRGDNNSISPRSGSFFNEITDRFRLISRLMMDSRVNPFIKVLPVGAIIYALWPMDLPTPIDDVFVLWFGTTLFVQLCPPEVVEEHTQRLESGANPAGWRSYSPTAQQGEVIDGEYFEHDAQKKNRTSSR